MTTHLYLWREKRESYKKLLTESNVEITESLTMTSSQNQLVELTGQRSQNINVAAELFQEQFNGVAHTHAPFKLINVKEGAPAWITGDYLGHVDERKHLAKMCKRSPTQENMARKVEQSRELLLSKKAYKDPSSKKA